MSDVVYMAEKNYHVIASNSVFESPLAPSSLQSHFRLLALFRRWKVTSQQTYMWVSLGSGGEGLSDVVHMP